MKKIFILAALLLSTALTALSISRKNEHDSSKLEKSSVVEKKQVIATTVVLATAD